MSPSLAIARRAVDAAPMIPLSAAGRQPLFFFGTLMDLDVLAYLLERPVDLDDLEPATITGFRRMTAVGPLSRARARAGRRGRGSAVAPGHCPRHRADQSLRERGVSGGAAPVTTGAGREVAAWLYLGLDGLEASDVPWSLEDWRRTVKPGFFAACDGWMADFEEPMRPRSRTGKRPMTLSAAQLARLSSGRVPGAGGVRSRGRAATGCARAWTSSWRASTPRACAPCSRPTTSATPRTTGSSNPATRSASSSSPGRSTPRAGCASPRSCSINKVGHALHDLDPVFARSRASRRCAELAARARPRRAAAAAVDVHLQAAADRRRGGLPPGQHLPPHRAA